MSYIIKGTLDSRLRDDLLTTMDTVFDNFFNQNYSGLAKSFLKEADTKGSYPKINIIDNRDHYILEATIPGYKKEDVSIEIKDGVLVIRGRASTEKESGGQYLWREIKRSKFQRSFSLPDNLDLGMINATIDNGILSIRIPVKDPLLKKSDVIEVKIK